MGPGPLKAAGSRWAIAVTSDLYNVAYHARSAQLLEGVTREEFDPERGMRKTWSPSMYCVMPMQGVIYKPLPGAPPPQPFTDRMPHVSEFLVSRATTGKQLLFSRSDYDISTYGQVNHDSHFRSSQFAHVGLIVDGDDPSVLDFYEDTLGLLRTLSRAVHPNPLTEALLDFTPGA